MDLDDPQPLAKILSANELEQIPEELQKKLSNYFGEVIESYCKEKAASYRIGDYEEKTEELQNQVQDYQEKLRNYEQNVAELRTQLNQVSEERKQLQDSVSNHDLDVVALRKEKNAVVEERDALLKLIERHQSEEQRMKADIQIYQQQLNNALSAKCEAIARVDEIESKEVAFQMKERRMEQEHSMMQNEIHMLRSDLNRKLSEIQNLHRDSTTHSRHLDTCLTQKTNELKIVNVQVAQLQKNIDELKESVANSAQRLLQQKEEFDKIIENYKKELDMKAKLVNIYKERIEDGESERIELGTAIAELKRLISTATTDYGNLETELKAVNIKHEQEMVENNKIIESLKQELVHANELLKEMQQESVESAISKLAPTAAVTSRLIRSDMSLTELYSQYAKATEELELQKRENARLNLNMKNILDELNERAPVIEKQHIEYKNIVEANAELTQQQEALLNKNNQIEQNLNEAELKANHLERENKKLKRSQDDMFRQMTCLIQEVEHLRIGIQPQGPPTHSGDMKTSDDVITKKLVTFTSVVELQENNQKLLLLVRDLTNKLEDIENKKQEIDETENNRKLESYVKRLQDIQETLNQKNTALSTVMTKCERYKKMYFEAQKTIGKQFNQSQNDSSILDTTQTDATDNAETNKERTKELDVNSEMKIRSLEQQLKEANERIKSIKEQYEYYKGEKQNNDKLLQEQFDSMRTEVRQLTSVNCKLTNSLDYIEEQKNLLQKNNSTYKQQIQTLEERNKNYENTIVKHEQTVLMLKDEIMNSQRKAAIAEAEVNNFRHENRIIKDTVARLQAEKEIYNREQQSQSLLLNNLEFIKSNLERSETEGRLRLEQRLEETIRELSAQRRRFQEEEDRNREQINDFRRQTETAKKLMEDEKREAEKLGTELANLRDDLSLKTKQLDELSKKLQESLTPSKDENPISAANKKAREFEHKLEESKVEIDSLKRELSKAREHGDQFYKMSQTAETEIKRLHDIHTTYLNNTESQISLLKQSEEALKMKISDLEAEVMLSTVTESSKNVNQSDQLKLAQEELKNTLIKLTEANSSIRTLRSENETITESLNNVESKYANEMVLHSSDIQELTKLKAEFTKMQDEIKELKCARDSSEDAYEKLKKMQEDTQSLVQSEKQEYENRVQNLDELNSKLHDQIEALTSKLFLLTQSGANPNLSSTSHNESTADTSIVDLNQSKLDEENKNNEQLLQIIKYLRREKDLSTAKLDIVKAENARLLSEHTILQKKIEETNVCLNQERAKSESSIISASKHEEILRKIETLNAITDSNRILREERNNLTSRVKEMKDRNSSMEEELIPLKKQNSELTSKVDELSVENSSLRTEAMKWRQRANALVEKSNKNPEEFKRLQLERENLAKMLTNEKEIQKKAAEEIASLKTRLDSELPVLSKQVQVLTEERRKLYDETLAAKQNNTRMAHEVMELKNRLLQKEDELQKTTDEIQAKENLLQDLRKKELQIRKIAKHYKDSYHELAKSKAGDNVDISEGGMVEDNGGTNSASSNEVDTLRSQIENLNSTLNTKQAELEEVRKELESVKNSTDVQVLKEAKARLVTLTESKNQAQQELATYKRMHQTQVATDDGIKASYDEKISNLEKELSLNKETITRLTRENESLHMRINQLNRQLGLQQSAKPSTSSVANTEKGGISDSSPRTANVKPMSGSATVQQSATVTPWRGGETPLASIRPISVQNSRTAAILPTSQQTSAGSSSTSTTSSTSSASGSGSSAAGNTALVPPQQQVHTTGSSTLESIASSSPTSSHTDYMPSTSTAAVAVATIPPMGASAAESSQEAESVQQPQQNDAQLYASGGQPQAVALVSPRVEGSSSSSSSALTTTSVQNNAPTNTQLLQDTGNQQPSTSGSSSCSTVVSSHSRHTPSSSSVTTTQAGCSSLGHKRPRDVDGDSTNAEESTPEKMSKSIKRMRTPQHIGENITTPNIGDSGIDVDQMPTSSQRDQEDDIVVVSEDEEEEEDVMEEADDDVPMEGGDTEQEGYEYEQDHDVDDTEEVNESNAEIDLRIDQDNNEVEIDESLEPPESQQCTSGTQLQNLVNVSAENTATSGQDNHQQSQAISSGSGEPSGGGIIPQSIPLAATPWKQASSSTSTTSICHPDNSAETVSSPQVSKSAYSENEPSAQEDGEEKTSRQEASDNESTFASDKYVHKSEEGEPTSEESKKSSDGEEAVIVGEITDADEDFVEETAGGAETSEQGDMEGHNSTGATQSEIQDSQLSQIEGNLEENEGTDGVSSEGEKQAVEGVEEEGREAEATTSPTINTRSKTNRGTTAVRRGSRIAQRGVNNRQPIIWQEGPGSSRNMHNLRHQDQQQPGSPNRNYNPQRGQRGRRPLRRPSGGNPYGNMRFP